MNSRARVRWVTALATAVVVAAAAFGLVGATPAPRHPSAAGSMTAAARSGSRVRPLKATTVAAELSELTRTGLTGGSAKTVADLVDAPGMPACAPPPIPAATYPPGNSYGVPFLAAITNGQVLAGYDEWTANHLTWRAQGSTYTLYPWQAKIYDITGWVTGLLELPSLTAQIPPQDIVFCDNQGNVDCVSADYPAGQCIHILAQYGPSPASSVPPDGLGNDHPEGSACIGYTSPGFDCFPLVVSLTPSGDTSLSVSGVEPDGALDLQVTTSAEATVTEVPPAPSPTTTCTSTPVTVSLSTVAPSTLPATAPEAPSPANTDDRTLQTAPLPLTGPLASGTSAVAGNDFSVPAFVPSAGGSPCNSFLTQTLNTYTGGWNSVFKDQSEGLYFLDGGTASTAAQPGWAQFSATTTVVTLGLPVGPPAGFNF